MKTKQDKILVIMMAVFLAVIIVSFFIATFQIRVTSSTIKSVSPRLFPRAVIALLAIASIIGVIGDYRKEEGDGKSRNIKAIVLSILIMFISVLLLDTIGFIIIGFLFMLLEITIAGGERITVKTILISLCCSVIFSLLFRYGFKIGIPLLPFGIL